MNKQQTDELKQVGDLCSSKNAFGLIISNNLLAKS